MEKTKKYEWLTEAEQTAHDYRKDCIDTVVTDIKWELMSDDYQFEEWHIGDHINAYVENACIYSWDCKEILKKLNLPDPETMKTGDNFKEFLKKNVPEHVKKRALRKLWLTNPIFANLDGMNEYDEDFTLATSALEEFATNYVVGKGFKGQFKKDTDIAESDFLEQDDTLKSSSVRLNE